MYTVHSISPHRTQQQKHVVTNEIFGYNPQYRTMTSE
jgi:hypothetical protein